jgi:AAA domain/Bifunctional DNA primase/polymerase, N-terminal
VTATATSNGMLTRALALRSAGFSLIPIKRDGSKAPEGDLLPGKSWNPFRERLATPDELAQWFHHERPPGMAAVCGRISGGLETIDFDKDAETVFPDWCKLVEDESPGLIARLSITRTPKPGFHVRYRVEGGAVEGNQPLARDATGTKLIETRGEGGYALIPGCPADCHETGRLYEHHSGSPLERVEVITAAEREILLRCARSFDRSPQEDKAAGKWTFRVGGDGLLPGDDYNQRGPDWGTILVGWVEVGRRGQVRYWRRPEKARGWSATTGHCTGKDGADLLAVFSSNAQPFEGPTGGKQCTCYSKFAAYALIYHNGDFSAAAKELVQLGYGQQTNGGDGNKPKWPMPKKASEVSRDAKPVKWVWNGIIPAAHIVLLSALFKVGKSTLVSLLLKALESASAFLGLATAKCRVLIVTEESDTIWRKRIDALQIGDHVELIVMPFLVRPTHADWQSFIQHLLYCHQVAKYDLIIFDTLNNQWSCQNENEASEQNAALLPLRQLTQAGLAVLLIAHLGKNDFREGKATRGSTALMGFVDIIIELRRFKADDEEDRRRVLQGRGRFDETPREIVIRLGDDGESYTLEGTGQKVHENEILTVLLDILPTEPPGWSWEEIEAEWEGPKPQRSAVKRALKTCKLFLYSGSGKKGNPTRWYRTTDSGKNSFTMRATGNS